MSATLPIPLYPSSILKDALEPARFGQEDAPAASVVAPQRDRAHVGDASGGAARSQKDVRHVPVLDAPDDGPQRARRSPYAQGIEGGELEGGQITVGQVGWLALGRPTSQARPRQRTTLGRLRPGREP